MPNDMATDEIERTRRIVYNGLKDFVSESALSTLVRFAAKLAATEPFSAQKYLDHLCKQNPSLVPVKGQVFSRMVRLRVLKTEDLEPVAFDEGPSSRASKAQEGTKTKTQEPSKNAPVERVSSSIAPTAQGNGIFKIFDKLTQELLYEFLRRDPRAADPIRRHLQQSVPKLGMTSPGQLEIQRWSSRPTNYPLIQELTREDMHKFLHTMYIWSCETHGPVDADKIFSRAIRETEELPEATDFPPKELL